MWSLHFSRERQHTQIDQGKRDQDGGEVCNFKYGSQGGLIENMVYEPRLKHERVSKSQGFVGKENAKQRISWCKGPGAGTFPTSLWNLELV